MSALDEQHQALTPEPVEPVAKRHCGGLDEQSNALSKDQLAKIEENRRLAAERRKRLQEEQTAAPGGVSKEQLAKIEENRRLAAERRQRLQEASGVPTQTGAGNVQPSAQEQLAAKIEENRRLAAERRQKRLQEAAAAAEGEAHQSQQLPVAPTAVLRAVAGLSDDDDDSSCSSSSPCSSSISTSSVSSSSDSSDAEVAEQAQPPMASSAADGLSDQQRAQIEANRAAALARRQKLGLTADQRNRIQRSRRAALAKAAAKRRQAAAAAKLEAQQLAEEEQRDDGTSSSSEADDIAPALAAPAAEAGVQQPPVAVPEIVDEKMELIRRNRQMALEAKRKRVREKFEKERAEAEAVAAQVQMVKSIKERTAKQAVVAKLLCRWWYVLPAWPPEDFDYKAALDARMLRCVPIQAFHLEPDFDERGMQKVFGFKNWPGLYRDQYGVLVDVRPVDGKPSYDQLMKRSMSELQRLLVKAYEKQLEVLILHAQGVTGEEQVAALRKEVKEAKHKAAFVGFFTPKTDPAEKGNSASAAKSGGS